MRNQPRASAQDTLDADAVFRLLSHPRRRALLVWLDDRGAPATLSDAAAALARRERDESDDRPSREVVRRICMALYHTHAPKLAAESLVEFDPEREHVAITERGESVIPLVDLASEVGFLTSGPHTDPSSSPS